MRARLRAKIRRVLQLQSANAVQDRPDTVTSEERQQQKETEVPKKPVGISPTLNSEKELWYGRKCFICESLGHCEHREPELQSAYREAWRRTG